MAGTLGIDVSAAVSASQWRRFIAERDVRYGIVRCFRSNGRVDRDGARTIQNGWEAGLSNIDVYHFPRFGLSAEGQVRESVNALRAAGARFGRYWIDVETGAHWSTDAAENAAFLQQLLEAVSALGLSTGIYTSPFEWQRVMGASTSFSSYPLWYAHYDDTASFADFPRFHSFGGWTQPAMKQFAGDRAFAEVQYDANWVPEQVTVGPREAAPPIVDTTGLISKAFAAGSISELAWTEIPVGDLIVTVATDAVKAPLDGQAGVRLPVTYQETIALCARNGWVAPSQTISDALYARARVKLVAKGLWRPGVGNMATSTFVLTTHRHIEDQLAREKPSSGDLVAGAWKYWILHPKLVRSRAVNYGFWNARGGPGQPVEAGHYYGYTDYSQLLQPVKRMARRAGSDREVDLLEVYKTKEHVPESYLAPYR